MAEQLLRKEEAREVLRVSRPTLDRMISRGDLPVVRLSEKTEVASAETIDVVLAALASAQAVQ